VKKAKISGQVRQNRGLYLFLIVKIIMNIFKVDLLRRCWARYWKRHWKREV